MMTRFLYAAFLIVCSFTNIFTMENNYNNDLEMAVFSDPLEKMPVVTIESKQPLKVNFLNSLKKFCCFVSKEPSSRPENTKKQVVCCKSHNCLGEKFPTILKTTLNGTISGGITTLVGEGIIVMFKNHPLFRPKEDEDKLYIPILTFCVPTFLGCFFLCYVLFNKIQGKLCPIPQQNTHEVKTLFD